MEIEHTVSALLLAAGFSTRFGSPKQITDYGSQTLLATTYTTLLKSGIDEIFIIIPEIENICIAAKDLTTNILINSNATNRGIGSSIKNGVRGILQKRPYTKAILLALCDQPLIQPCEYENLLHIHETSNLICASSYNDTIGVPCIIPARYFDRLLLIEDTKGAKEFLYQEIENVCSIPLPNAEHDIDERKTLMELLHSKKSS